MASECRVTPDLERFLEIATRPLEDQPDAREEARAELMGRASHQGMPLEMVDVSAETEVLETVAVRSPWIRRSALLIGLVLCLIGFAVGGVREGLNLWRSSAAQGLSYEYLFSHSYVGFWTGADSLHKWRAKVAPDLLITGDSSLHSGLDDETRKLRAKFPEDLAILQEHLSRRLIKEDEFMTAEERALVARLDSDNALWPWMESGWLCDKGYGRERGERSYMRTSVSMPMDQDTVAKSWDLYEEASTKTHFRDYSGALARRQIESFPDDWTFVGGMTRSAYTDLVFSAGDSRLLSFWGNPDSNLREKVARFTKDKDLGALKNFSEAWSKLNIMLVEGMNSHASGWNQVMGEEAGYLSEAFRQLGEKDLAKEFETIGKGAAGVPVRNYIPRTDPVYDYLPIRSEMAGTLPETINVDELEPARKAEWAYFERLVILLGVFVLLIVVFASGFEAYRRSASVKGMARGLMPLFTFRDHLWVALVGVAAPWLYGWVVTRFSPLAFMQYGMKDEWTAMGWLLQTSLVLVLILVMLVQAVQWRWSKRGAFLGFRGRVNWLGWAVAGVVAMAIPTVGVIREMMGSEDDKAIFLLAMVGAGFVGILWLLWVGGMNLFTSRHGALQPNLVSRTLLTWSIVSTGLLLVSAGILLQLEKSWNQKDVLFSLTTSETHINAIEERAIAEMRESLLKVLTKE